MAQQTHFAYSAKLGRVILSNSHPRHVRRGRLAQAAPKRRRLGYSAWAPIDEDSPANSLWRCECASCSWRKAPLEKLPPELLDRIAQYLAPNEVACTLRLLSRTLATHFRSHTTVQLWQPVPHHAFVRRFGRWSSVRSLPLAQRRKVIALTAASGSLENLRVVAGGPDVTQAVGSVGCALTAEVFTAAAAAGQLNMCKELYSMGCPWDTNTVEAAARRGDVRLVRAIVRSGCRWDFPRALSAAAAGGSLEMIQVLMDLQERGPHYTGGEWRDYNCYTGELGRWLFTAPRVQQHAATASTAANAATAATASYAASALTAASQDEAAADAAARAAAAAVDVDNLMWRQGLRPLGDDQLFRLWDIVHSAAYGLGLQQMAEYTLGSGVLQQGNRSLYRLSQAIAFALLSPTPDWRAKAQWLETRYAAAARVAAGAEAGAAVQRQAEAEAASRRWAGEPVHWQPAALTRSVVHLANRQSPHMRPDELIERLSWARRRGFRCNVPPPELLFETVPSSKHAVSGVAASGCGATAAAAVSAVLSWLFADQQEFPAARLSDVGFAHELVAAAACGGGVAALQAYAAELQRALAAAAGGAAAASGSAAGGDGRGGGLSSSADGGQPGGMQPPLQQQEAAGSRGCLAPPLPPPPSPPPPPPVPAWAGRAAMLAAEAGQLPVLRWLADTYGAAALYDAGTVWAHAAHNAHALEVLKLLREDGGPGGLEAAARAVSRSSSGAGDKGLQVLEWLLQQGFGLDAWAMEAAVAAGNVPLMSRLRDSGLSLSAGLWKPAVEAGWVEAVRWLQDHDCPLPLELRAWQWEGGEPAAELAPRQSREQLYKAAIRAGDLGMVQELLSMSEFGYEGSRCGVAVVGVREYGPALRSAACEAVCRCVPLIRCVLAFTRQRETVVFDPQLEGWDGIRLYKQGSHEQLAWPGAGMFPSAAMFDDWATKVQVLIAEHAELNKCSLAISKCHDLRLQNRLDSDAAVGHSMQVSVQMMAGAAAASLAQLRDMVECVLEWRLPAEGAEEAAEGAAEEEDDTTDSEASRWRSGDEEQEQEETQDGC